MFKVTTKLAFSNLLKNRQLYLPFTLASVTVVASLYIFLSLMHNPTLQTLRGGEAMQHVLNLGMYVVLIISGIIIWYANSFVMKNRTKELGLYNVLGLEKRHLHLMMLIELIFFASLTTGVGILLGILLDKMAFAALLKILHMPVQLVPTFQWQTVWHVALCFLMIYSIVLVVNMFHVQRLRSIELLKESKRGEKTGKFLKTQTVVGIALLGTAYYLAQTVVHPIKSLGTFFTAVLLVVFATYILFNAGTITLLQGLKHRKRYYYQPQNFISISNLIFRMRKNATGLATICLLSTMALVTIVGGAVLYIGSESTIRQSVPHAFTLSTLTPFSESNQPLTDVMTDFEHFAKNKKIPLETLAPVEMLHLFGDMNDNHLSLQMGGEIGTFSIPNTEIRTIDLTTYNRLTQANETLQENEVLLYTRNAPTASQPSLQIMTQTFNVKKNLAENPIHLHTPDNNSNVVSDFRVMVVPSLERLSRLIKESETTPFGFATQYVGFNTTINRADQIALYEAWQAQSKDEQQLLQSQANYATGHYHVVGSVFFVGAFLAVLFTMSLILVIYYKQLSEGFEDRSQFHILQKVGLDQTMIKRTIRKQMLIVFFMPILLAVVHMAFAYKNLTLILFMLSINNQALMLYITCITCIIFVAIYCLIYWITSKQYEHIVSA